MKQFKKLNICVITLPITTVVGAAILSNFIDILEPLSNELFVITGKYPSRPNKKIHVIRIKSDNKKELTLIRAVKSVAKQLKTTYNLIKISKNIDVVIFYIGTGIGVLPVLAAKVMKKRTIKVATGSSSKAAETDNRRLFGLGTIIFPSIFKFLERINYALSDQIVVYSENLIDQLELNKYKNKISSSGARFVDLSLFDVKNDLQERRNLICYIGRLSSEKGITNFANAIPLIFKKRDDLEFLIGGDGPLLDEIMNKLEKNGPHAKVEVIGWIPHENIPKYLNRVKLLVLPSYTEGLPNIMLEAMACGTPVLSTPVGGVPDVIKDGETGFILENNSPECIAENIERVLNHPALDEIIKNARKLVEKEFTYEAAVERYRKILESI